MGSGTEAAGFHDLRVFATKHYSRRAHKCILASKSEVMKSECAANDKIPVTLSPIHFRQRRHPLRQRRHFTDSIMSLWLEFSSMPVVTRAMDAYFKLPASYSDTKDYKWLVKAFPHVEDLISKACRSKSNKPRKAFNTTLPQ